MRWWKNEQIKSPLNTENKKKKRLQTGLQIQAHKCCACCYITMAVVECDFMISSRLHPLMLVCLWYMHAWLLVYFSVRYCSSYSQFQYYTRFQHTAEFKKCLLNIHRGCFMSVCLKHTRHWKLALVHTWIHTQRLISLHLKVAISCLFYKYV